MGKGTGIQLTDDYDLNISDGALQVGDVQAQNMALILITNPGEFKENPEVGVGIESWVNDDNPSDLKLEIKKQLKADDYTVSSVSIDGGDLNINAEY